MSCETLNSQPINLNVSFGSLPEGFCPASMQELGAAIAARLIISPNQAFTSFAIGSVEPTSNVGPWLKDCLEFFVFDDATSRYRPIAKGGFDVLDYRTASSSFVVPDNIFKLKIHAWGGGGGGGDTNGTAAFNSSGGGGGAYGLSIVNVFPGQVIPFVVGAGGGNGNPGTPGGSTTILGATAGGGSGGTMGGGLSPQGGVGGIAAGFTVNINGGPGGSVISDSTAPGGNGGDAGGWGGAGGPFGTSSSMGLSAVVPGGGGGGHTFHAGSAGSGAGGAILFEY